MDSLSHADLAASQIAFAIGEPSRARMLYGLLDGRARTSTELSLVASVAPSTASIHLKKLRQAGLLTLHVQGKHHYYSLRGRSVATLLENLNAVATMREVYVPVTPKPLRLARRCYDHLAGEIGVKLYDALIRNRWLLPGKQEDALQVTTRGAEHLLQIGLNLPKLQRSRRRLAYACLDWSERRPHLAGAIASAVLTIATERRWVVAEDNSRALLLSAKGRSELNRIFGLRFDGDHLGKA